QVSRAVRRGGNDRRGGSAGRGMSTASVSSGAAGFSPPKGSGSGGLKPAAPQEPWRGIFRDLGREHGFEPLHVEGRLPADLRGVLYRCGPARFSSPDGEPYLHWFDADGAIAAIRFGARCEAAVRLVDTRWLRDERNANR